METGNKLHTDQGSRCLCASNSELKMRRSNEFNTLNALQPRILASVKLAISVSTEQRHFQIFKISSITSFSKRVEEIQKLLGSKTEGKDMMLRRNVNYSGQIYFTLKAGLFKSNNNKEKNTMK